MKYCSILARWDPYGAPKMAPPNWLTSGAHLGSGRHSRVWSGERGDRGEVEGKRYWLDGFRNPKLTTTWDEKNLVKTRCWFQILFHLHPGSLGKIPNLTNMFPEIMGNLPNQVVSLPGFWTINSTTFEKLRGPGVHRLPTTQAVKLDDSWDISGLSKG